MKINSVSGQLCVVKDLAATIQFYEKLGFIFKTKENEHATAYVNWYWIEFVQEESVEKEVFQKAAGDLRYRGGGTFTEISVADVDEYYSGVQEKGLRPLSEPKTYPWGRREFILADPDGYKLVFFQKK